MTTLSIGLLCGGCSAIMVGTALVISRLYRARAIRIIARLSGERSSATEQEHGFLERSRFARRPLFDALRVSTDERQRGRIALALEARPLQPRELRLAIEALSSQGTTTSRRLLRSIARMSNAKLRHEAQGLVRATVRHYSTSTPQPPPELVANRQAMKELLRRIGIELAIRTGFELLERERDPSELAYVWIVELAHGYPELAVRPVIAVLRDHVAPECSHYLAALASEALPADGDLVDALIESLKRRWSGASVHACKTLKRLGEVAIERIRRELVETTELEVQKRLLRCVARVGDPKLGPAVKEIFRSAPDPRERLAFYAAVALVHIGDRDPEIAGPLAHVVRLSVAWPDVNAAVEALQLLGLAAKSALPSMQQRLGQLVHERLEHCVPELRAAISRIESA